MRTRGPFDVSSICSMTIVVSAHMKTRKIDQVLTYLIYVDVVKVVFVIDSFE